VLKDAVVYIKKKKKIEKEKEKKNRKLINPLELFTDEFKAHETVREDKEVKMEIE
jgi:hypothetical protein